MIKASICLGVALAMTALGAQNNNQSNPSHQNGNMQSNQTGQQSHHGSDMQSPKARQSREVGRMLHETEMARRAVQNQNKQQALQNIQQALNDANNAASGMNGRNLVPLYAELDEYSVIGPIMRHRQSNGSNSNGSNTANHGSADRSNNTNSTGRAMAVDQVVGDYTDVAIDLQSARQHLQAAQNALNNGNWDQAKQALQAVDDSLVVESIASDMPLLRAREDLVLARDNEKAGHYRQAQAQVRAASRALDDFERNSGTTAHKQEIERLRSEMNNDAQNMDTNRSDANSRIESWWNQTTGLMTPANSSNNMHASASNGSSSTQRQQK